VSDTRRPPGPKDIVVPIFRKRDGHRLALDKTPPKTPPRRRPARVAYMLALAIRIEKMIARGELHNRAEAAIHFGFTRARITQLLALTLLAPDIQEEILFLEIDNGVERITERTLRSVVSVDDWSEQRQRWHALRDRQPPP
jgi:hypothetical protein